MESLVSVIARREAGNPQLLRFKDEQAPTIEREDNTLRQQKRDRLFLEQESDGSERNRERA